jgi:NAD(P)-dependent dehydrogenase (short-subunit alcohol dehydrogenase family)
MYWDSLGQPEDIADAVAFPTGPDGAWINGQTSAPTAESSDPGLAHLSAILA